MDKNKKINKSLITSFKRQQLKELYSAANSSIVASITVGALIYYLFNKELSSDPHSILWIVLVGLITLVRGADSYHYYKQEEGKKNLKVFMVRFIVSSLFGALGWGLIIWNYFPLLSNEHQVYMMLIMVGVTSFATTTLSYSLSAVIPFMLIVIIPLEVRLYMEGTSYENGLAVLMMIYLIFQIGGTIRINKKYLQKIRSQIEYKELEKENSQKKNSALIRAKVAQTLQKPLPLKDRMLIVLREIPTWLGSSDKSFVTVLISSGAKNKVATYLKYQQNMSLSVNEINDDYTFLDDNFREVLASGCISTLDASTPISEKIRYYIVPIKHQSRSFGILLIKALVGSPDNEPTRLETLNHIGELMGVSIVNEKITINLRKGMKYAEDMAQAKADFLANMSHEIRTPMNGVLGMLDLLQNRPIDDVSKNYVETAYSSANMLLNVINDILDISKIESGKFDIENVDFDLRTSIENTTRLLFNLADKKGVKLSCHISPDIETSVKGDTLRLQQVMNNLISNAIKFTHKGKVSITVSTIKASLGSITLLFEVKDTGIGIPLDKQKTLFQAFTQADTSTSRKYGGTGLGLTISKKLVEMMGGKIGVQSAEGKGSRFWFELPFEVIDKKTNSDNQITFAVPQKEIIASATQLTKGKILLVDDNIVNRFVGEETLASLGLDFDVATDGEEAVAARKKVDYAAILMDCQMPIMDGYEATVAIREYERKAGKEHTPVIALTANAMQGDKEKCIESGMNGYLSKPYTAEQMSKELGKYSLNNDINRPKSIYS